MEASSCLEKKQQFSGGGFSFCPHVNLENSGFLFYFAESDIRRANKRPLFFFFLVLNEKKKGGGKKEQVRKPSLFPCILSYFIFC